MNLVQVAVMARSWIPFNKYLLIIYSVPGAVPGTEDTAMNKTTIPPQVEFKFE